jgi:glycosyltransferase involved in cell wall biosynthesis
MKIIFIFDSLVPSDVRKYLVDEILFLRVQGIDVRVVTLGVEDAKNTLYSDTLFTKETFTSLRIARWWNFTEWKKLKNYFETERPDLIITADTKADIVGRIVARISRVSMKVFVFAHDLSDISKRVKFFDDVLSHVTDYYIVTSEKAKLALSKFEVSLKKIVVMRDGILFEKYGQPPTRNIRGEFGIAPDEFVFVFLGELISEKNIPVMLRALARMSTGRLFIIGDGPEKAELKFLANSLDLKERVIFLDSYFDIPGLLVSSNAMILPSKTEEDISQPVILGLLSGLPIIATETEGTKELVKNQENGIFIRPQDSEDLAHAMNELIKNREFYESLRKNTRKELAKYSLSAHASKLLALAQEKK